MTDPSIQFNLFQFPFFFILLLLPLFIINRLIHKARNLPPGPFPWPVIGNILNFISENPHITVSYLAKIHGPLMSLTLGTQIVIMASSPETAEQILKIHDRDLSARRAPKATPIREADLRKFSLLWATDCTPLWKSIRVLWKTEIFSNKALEAQVSTREKKVDEMVEFLGKKGLGEVVRIGEIVFGTVYNTLGELCFSRDLVCLDDEGMVRDWKDRMWRFMECSTTPVVADFFHFLDGFGLDFLGKKKEATKCMKKMFGVWEGLIGERREVFGGKMHGDFLDFMLENGFLDVQILYMLLEILPAGAGTLVSTIEWAMAELIKNKDAMNKLKEELRNSNIINSNSIKESHISQLPYLNACIKETLRLHPPIPFLPHCAQSTCQVMNYTVPKDSLVFVNLWAIGHDLNLARSVFVQTRKVFGLEFGLQRAGLRVLAVWCWKKNVPRFAFC